MHIADPELDLAEKLRTAHARVAVIGLGYVGLPLATALAESGFTVTSLDLDDRKVTSIVDGMSCIDDIDVHTFARLVEEERLTATTDPAVLGAVDAAIICVPTPCTKTRQ